MPLPRSEYLSDVWKDGIFGTTLSLLQTSTPQFVWLTERFRRQQSRLLHRR